MVALHHHHKLCNVVEAKKSLFDCTKHQVQKFYHKIIFNVDIVFTYFAHTLKLDQPISKYKVKKLWPGKHLIFVRLGFFKEKDGTCTQILYFWVLWKKKLKNKNYLQTYPNIQKFHLRATQQCSFFLFFFFFFFFFVVPGARVYYTWFYCTCFDTVPKQSLLGIPQLYTSWFS